VDQSQRLVGKPKIDIDIYPVAAWVVEACMGYAYRSISATGIGSNLIIYAFSLGRSNSYLLSKCRSLEMRVESVGDHVVGLAT
jgi:hypothetical protein